MNGSERAVNFRFRPGADVHGENECGCRCARLLRFIAHDAWPTPDSVRAADNSLRTASSDVLAVSRCLLSACMLEGTFKLSNWPEESCGA